MALLPYSGPWGWDQAAHLMRRSTFGATKAQIDAAVVAGLSGTLTSLFTVNSLNQPLTVDPAEQIAPMGQTWVDKVLPAGSKTATESARQTSMRAWMVERFRVNDGTIVEKMCVFWQNHFANAAVFDARATYHYHMLLRQFALGDVKQFVKELTISPSMLIFLSGQSNNVYSPNENFARELLELFTVSKGAQVGVGDYTNYTETDISQSSKIFTGWYSNNLWSETDPTVSSIFEPTYHDNSTKTLGAAFGNGVISPVGANEYLNYIDLIFASNATSQSIALFLSRKLYRYFVNYDITPLVESTVIIEMANQLIADNYVIENTVKALLGSDHFYDSTMRGTMIKNPLEFVTSVINTTQMTSSLTVPETYSLNNEIYWSIASLGMYPLDPPNVGGWFAYYQAPAFTRLWANSTYLKNRFNFSSWLAYWSGYDINGTIVNIDVLAFVATLSVPNDPNVVIDELVLLFFPKDITAIRKLALKNILTSGLPDFEWTNEYNDYIANNSNPTYVDPVRNRLKLLLHKMLRFPEFQLQ